LNHALCSFGGMGCGRVAWMNVNRSIWTDRSGSEPRGECRHPEPPELSGSPRAGEVAYSAERVGETTTRGGERCVERGGEPARGPGMWKEAGRGRDGRCAFGSYLRELANEADVRGALKKPPEGGRLGSWL
jgi:hypothetical protein